MSGHLPVRRLLRPLLLLRSTPGARRVTQIQTRSASGWHYYLSGGSNDSTVSEEVKDLIRNQKTIDNIDEWRRGHGIQDPVRLSIRDRRDRDDDQHPDAVYFPHKGEEWPEEYTPSPVLLVKKVRRLRGEPYWHKETCERFGEDP